MKEKVNSTLIGLLLSFTILFLACFLTLLNKNFYRHELENRNYYEKVYNKIKEEIDYYDSNISYELDIKDVEQDMNYYIGNNFDNTTFNKYDNKKLNEIYNNNIKFRGFFPTNYNKIKIIIIVVMIALIIVTFELYLNLKCERYNFLFMSGFLGLIINFIMYKSFYFNNEIIDSLYNTYMIYYLVANIFQIVYSVYLYFLVNKKTVKKR